MNELGINELNILERRGISLDYSDPDQLNVALTSEGLCWIFNYLYLFGIGDELVSPQLFRDIARSGPLNVNDGRSLIIKANFLPTYGASKIYSLISIYLDSTPPKLFTILRPTSDSNMLPMKNEILIPEGGDGALLFDDSICIGINFTDEEIEELCGNSVNSRVEIKISELSC